MQSDEVSDAAFGAGAGQAERNLKGRPAALCPLQGAGGASVRERWRSFHARCTEQCKWGAAAKDLPTEILDSKNGLLGAQQLVRRRGDDACQADMLSSFDLDATQGQRDAGRLRSSSGGPAGAFGVAAEADHAMVCEKVAKVTQMRHDDLANALRLVVSACRCQSAAEPRYRTLAGKKGMEKGMVKCQRQGDTVAVLPRLGLAAVDIVVAHASAKSYAAEVAKTAGWTLRRAERPSGRGSGRMSLITLHSGLCRLRLRCAGTWARRR